MVCRLAVSAAVLAILSGAGSTYGQVTVFSGTNSQATGCSQAARRGDASLATLSVFTLAIEHEALPARDLAGTYVNRGVLRLRLGDLDRADADFDTALEIEPGMGEAWINRGAAMIAERHWEKGVADIDHGLTLNPQEPEKAYFNRAIAKEKLDDVKGAYFDYLKAAELAPMWDLPQVELKRFNVSTRPKA